MELKIERRKKVNLGSYAQKDLDIAYAFSREIIKELKQFVKAVVLFGSTARRATGHEKEKTKGDIDILLIVDDVGVEMSRELITAYRIITEKIVAKISKRLHVTTMRFTNFWEYIRAGDPVAVNILRDGVAILDTGFFEPMQMLLYQGRVRPSAESIFNYFNRAPQTLQNAKWHIMQATIDLYWAVIDASHAALMKMNVVPPSPAHVADLLEERMVKTKLIDKKYPAVMREFYNIAKMIGRNEISSITGEQFDNYLKEASEFVEVMRKFVEEK